MTEWTLADVAGIEFTCMTATVGGHKLRVNKVMDPSRKTGAYAGAFVDDRLIAKCITWSEAQDKCLEAAGVKSTRD